MVSCKQFKLGDKVVCDGQSQKYKGRTGILTRELVGMWGLRIEGTELFVRDEEIKPQQMAFMPAYYMEQAEAERESYLDDLM